MALGQVYLSSDGGLCESECLRFMLDRDEASDSHGNQPVLLRLIVGFGAEMGGTLEGRDLIHRFRTQTRAFSLPANIHPFVFGSVGHKHASPGSPFLSPRLTTIPHTLLPHTTLTALPPLLLPRIAITLPSPPLSLLTLLHADQTRPPRRY